MDGALVIVARAAEAPEVAERAKAEARRHALRGDVVFVGAVEERAPRRTHELRPRGGDGGGVAAAAMIGVRPDAALGGARGHEPRRVADRDDATAVDRHRPRAELAVEELVPF